LVSKHRKLTQQFDANLPQGSGQLTLLTTNNNNNNSNNNSNDSTNNNNNNHNNNNDDNDDEHKPQTLTIDHDVRGVQHTPPAPSITFAAPILFL
jgi:hypothetical protein